MKLSVIIPVYKVEQTLEQCVESVLHQDFEDMEIILVDDSSPDKCPQMCDSLQEKHPGIRVIHRPNGGLSAARNTGIAAAKGQYITFIDSDDWLGNNTLRPLMEMLCANPGIDLLEYPIDIKQEKCLQLTDCRYDDSNKYWTATRAYTHTYACNKVYRAALFSEVRFPEGKVFEDVWIIPRILQRASMIATTGSGLYHYRRNPSGITAQAKGCELTSLLEAHLSSPFPTPLSYLLNIQLDVFRFTGRIILPDNLPSDKAESLKDRVKQLLYKQIGVNRLCKIHKAIVSLW